MFHDEDDDFSNLPVKPRGGGKVNMPADDFDSLPVMRRGGGGSVIPTEDPFDNVKIGSSNGVLDIDNVTMSVNNDDIDEFDSLPVKPRGSKVVIPEEEKGLQSPGPTLNGTSSNNKPVLDLDDMPIKARTPQSFDDMPIKAKSPQSFDDMPINAKSPQSFDDMPVNAKSPQSFDDMPINAKSPQSFNDMPINSNPASDFDNIPVSSKPVTSNLDDLSNAIGNLAIDDIPIRSKVDNSSFQDFDDVPVKLNQDILNLKKETPSETIAADDFDDLPVKPRGAKPVVVPDDDLPTKLEGNIIMEYRPQAQKKWLLFINFWRVTPQGPRI